MTLRSFADLLPGLYLLALVEALALLLRRGFDPLPARIRILFFAVLAVLFGGALFGGGVLLPLDNLRTAIPFRQLPPAVPPGHGLQGDLVHQITPWMYLVREGFFQGGWPLWNRSAGAGMPLLADPQAQVLQPLVGITYPLPLWPAIGVLAALRVWTALAFTFLLLRRQRLAEPAACFGALTYGCGGFLMLWLGWPVANSGALLPAALYAVTLNTERGWRRDRVFLTGALAALLLAGHPETMLYALALTALFLLSRAGAQAALRGRREALRTLAGCSLPFLLAFGLAAPVLLPALDFLPTTARAAIVEHNLGGPLPGFGEILLPGSAATGAWRERAGERLAAIVAPRAFGNLETYWGSSNAIEDGSGFAGSVALILALLALLPSRSSGRAPQERLMAWVLAGSLLLIAQPEGIGRFLIRIPGLRATVAHQNHRILLLVSFTLAYLAACQLHRWLRNPPRRLRIAGTALALGCGIGLAFALWPPAASLKLGFDFQSPALAAQLSALALASFLLLLSEKRLRPRPAAWGIALIATCELVATFRPAHPPAPRRLAYPQVEALRFLTARAGRNRIAGVGSSVLSANFAALYGLSDVRVNNPSLPITYEAATFPIQRRSLTGHATFGRPSHPLYGLLGVRYIVARPGVPIGLPLVFRDPSAWIYERPGALPTLFLPARAKPHLKGSWIDFLLRNPDFSARALVETVPSPGSARPQVWKAADPAASRLTIQSERATHVAARALLAEPRLLASGVLQDGHWRVLANGIPLRPVTTNGTFVGAWLPAGELRVDLLYRPAPWCLGTLLCALALAIAGTLWSPPPARMVSSRSDGSSRA